MINLVSEEVFVKIQWNLPGAGAALPRQATEPFFYCGQMLGNRALSGGAAGKKKGGSSGSGGAPW